MLICRRKQRDIINTTKNFVIDIVHSVCVVQGFLKRYLRYGDLEMGLHMHMQAAYKMINQKISFKK